MPRRVEAIRELLSNNSYYIVIVARQINFKNNLKLCLHGVITLNRKICFTTIPTQLVRVLFQWDFHLFQHKTI